MRPSLEKTTGGHKPCAHHSIALVIGLTSSRLSLGSPGLGRSPIGAVIDLPRYARLFDHGPRSCREFALGSPGAHPRGDLSCDLVLVGAHPDPSIMHHMVQADPVEPETWAVMGGRAAQGAGAPLNVPPVLASNLALGSGRAFSRDDATPTCEALEELLGGLEGGSAVAFASGMGVRR